MNNESKYNNQLLTREEMKQYFEQRLIAPRLGLISRLVTQELHYCCEFRFFSLYRRAGLIAARLGVSPQAVRARRRLFKAGEMACQGCAGCQRPVK